MLTPLQRRVLDLLAEAQRTTGICPTYAEIAAAIGVVSKSSVHRNIVALEERGFVRRHGVGGGNPSRAYVRHRAIEVLRLPAGPGDPSAALLHRFCEHFGPELAGLRRDCFDPDGTPADASLLAFVEAGEALIGEARALLGEGGRA